MAVDHPIAPDVLSLIGALVISLVSGSISIAQRVVRGQEASLLWVTSEYLSAALCGYLTYTAYPAIQGSLPEWITMPILVATVAHFGGRTFQGVESLLIQRYGIPLPDRRTNSANDKRR